MSNLTHEQRQELRYAVRAYLAERFPAALTSRQIGHAVRREIDFPPSPEDVTNALEYQAGMTPSQAVRNESAMGATDLWQATTAGVRAWERNEP